MAAAEQAEDLCIGHLVAEMQDLRADVHDVVERVQCFEDKKSRKAVAFGFRHYPHEVLAYCVVLGWVGREDEAQEYLADLIERGSLSAKNAERMMTEVRAAWLRGAVL